MGSSGDILVGSVEPPALNRRLADPRPSRASNSVAPVFLERAGGQDAHAPKRAERPRTQAGGTPTPPGGRNARAPRQIMPQSSTTLSSLLQSQIEPGALLRRQTHLQRNQVGGEFLRRAAPYQRIDIEWLAQHIRQGDLRDA